MTTKELLQQYEEYKLKISAYSLAMTTMYFDMQTTAPKKSGIYRNPRLAYLEGELFSLTHAQEYFDLLETLSKAEDADELTRKETAAILKDLNKTRNIPKDVYVAYSELSLNSENAWEEAYHANDYSIFEPYLKKVIEGKSKLLTYRDDYGTKSNYDLLLDDYEPGMNSEEYDKFFNLIKEELVPLIHKIVTKGKIDDSFLYKHYPREIQAKVMKELMDYLHFDFESGILRESLHPFTSSFSKYDNRITTKYLEDKLDSSIFSVIHESGHATYNAQVSDELAETYFFDNMSMGMHESQSRTFEIYLGKNRAFWEANYPLLQNAYPEQLGDVTLDQFVDAINASTPSLIRTEADELTYPLHILIRYEIEKALFNGEISVEHLDEVWNSKYEEYLGIRPEDDRTGILQDVHWSDGSFGYFPTYALGSAYAAQFIHAMRKDLDIEDCLRNSRFDLIKDWLKEHIHKYGGINLPKDQIKIATGDPFDPHYYINHLKEKYTRLYHLDEE